MTTRKEQEVHLVYMVPYLGTAQMSGATFHVYNTLKGTSQNNKHSKDKDQYDHCYNDLIIGENYVVFTENKKPTSRHGRWVFTKCYKLDDEQMARDLCNTIKAVEYEEKRDSETKIPGYVTTFNIFKQAAVAVVERTKERANTAEQAGKPIHGDPLDS